MATVQSPPSTDSTSPKPSPQPDSLQPVAASPLISRISNSQSASPPASPPSGSSSAQSSTVQLTASPASISSIDQIATSPTSHLRQTPAFQAGAARLSTASLSFSLSHRDSFVPQFPSSLPYTAVRDFAYPNLHPLHYGPLPSEEEIPVSSSRDSELVDTGSGGWYSGNTFGFSGMSGHFRRQSDPAGPSFDEAESSGGWSGNWESHHARKSSQGKGAHIPPLKFADGPPYAEDPDLHSPVVISTHRKHKSSNPHMQSSQGYSRRPSKNAVSDPNAPDAGDSARGQSRSNSVPGEPGGEFHNAPGGQGYYEGDNGEISTISGDGFSDDDEDDDLYAEGNDDFHPGDPSRLSNQYFITIASPAEEMHGKAVALFDFQKENENELALVEGQVIWVSYRHGMGWLVAEDPKTRESGLVPEEYVRLLRDIQQPLFVEGSPGADNTELDDSVDSDNDGGHAGPSNNTAGSNSAPQSSPAYSNGMKPIVSTFSTSSQDVHPYPLPLHEPGELPPPRNPSRAGFQTAENNIDTPTAANWDSRIEALERARERALLQEELAGYKRPVEQGAGDETPRASSANGPGSGSGWGGHARKESREEGRKGSVGLGFVQEEEDDEEDESYGIVGRKNIDRGKEKAKEGEVAPLEGNAADIESLRPDSAEFSGNKR